MQELRDTYKTISVPSSGIYKEKKSKFLAFAFPVLNEEEIKKYIAELKKEYFDARHHCYAYILGINKDVFRSSDDNEPSGTAGKPILGQINSLGLTNILIVVVRYFGGTLLGTGGLVRAYAKAAADALQKGKIVEKTVNSTFTLSFDYKVMNHVMHVLKEENAEQLYQKFDQTCNIIASIRNSRIDILEKKLNKIESLKFSITKT